jgi:uncharacterized protein (TIGR00255 family)
LTIASMTGFARVSGTTANYRWAWELKSVNAKGLDVRIRVPPGFDAIEAEVRAALAAKLTRGTCYATLTAQREATAPDVYINEALLGRLVDAISKIEPGETLRPVSVDGLLGVRGVVEIRDANDGDDSLAQVQRASLAGLAEALGALVAMREGEGAALHQILAERLTNIAGLRQAAENSPARKPEAIRARLAESIALLAGQSKFDETRLYQEALLLAAKVDVREELDRLQAHVAACTELLDKGGPIGRRLDFLAQELGREANTLCAKSNDVSLTAIGLELRVEIEQFREQVQNIE